MNKRKIISFTGMMIISASSLAQVKISVPDNVQLLVANGLKPELSGGLFDSEKTLHLADGQQQIVFRYKPYFAQGKDNIGVESDVIIATFNATDKSFVFKLPQYRNAKDAGKSIKRLKWSLVDQDGNRVHLTEDKLMKEGMQIGRNYLTEAAIYNQSGAVASVAGFSPQNMQIQTYQAQRQAMPHQTQKASSAGSNMPATAETMLHYWYDQADDATKARFRQFISQNQ